MLLTPRLGEVTSRLNALMVTLWKEVPQGIYAPSSDLPPTLVPDNIQRHIMKLEWDDVVNIATTHKLACTLANAADHSRLSFLMLHPESQGRGVRRKLRILFALERTHFVLDPAPEGESGDWLSEACEFVLSSQNALRMKQAGLPQPAFIIPRL